MKKFLFVSLFALLFSSCVTSQLSYSPVESYCYEYRYEYYYNGNYRPVIYVNGIALYYYLDDWYCIPSHHYRYICPMKYPRYFYTRKFRHHTSKPYSIPHKPKPNKPVHRPHNKEGVLNNDRFEYKRPFPSHNKPRSNRRSISDKRVKK